LVVTAGISFNPCGQALVWAGCSQRCHHINHIKGPQYLVISKLYFASPSGKETDIIKTTVKRLFFLPENGTKAAGKGIDI